MSDKRRALISVSNKDGVVDFARGLVELGFEVVSTGGTMSALEEAKVPVTAVSQVTGVPEILGGRVKTLHPAIFAGILARRELLEDLTTLRDLGLGLIDVVAVNLYPFEKTAAKPGAQDHEIIEQIDIGGPSLLRAAAKNHVTAYAVVDPADYPSTLRAIAEGREAEGREFRRDLARKVFCHCSAYDSAIASYLSVDGRGCDWHEATEMPAKLSINWPITHTLRYGENPHQAAAFYANPNASAPSLAHCKQLQGKDLSYNNYLDGDAALEMARDLDAPGVVIMKHANPCGVGRGATLEEAWKNALAGDPVSAFGGIAGLTSPVDAATATAMAELFLEVIIAPSFSPEALAILGKKKNLRLLEAGPLTPRLPAMTVRSVSGGILAQTGDTSNSSRESMTVMTKSQPNAADWDALIFANKVVHWVKSNAIVYASRERVLGVGAGQMSRIDSAKFGLQKAGDVKGAYMASDGFFPFRDVVDLAASAGIRAIIQPGGSMRDEESVAAANEHGIIMVVTGRRHFRH